MGKWYYKTGSGQEAYFMFCFSTHCVQFWEELKNMCLVNLWFHSGYHENDCFLRLFYGEVKE